MQLLQNYHGLRVLLIQEGVKRPSSARTMLCGLRVLLIQEGVKRSLLISITISVDAASANIKVTTSKSQVVVGNTFTVTTKISGSNLGSWQWTLNYDTKKFKLVSGGNVFFFSESGENQKTKTWTLKAIAKGSGTVSVKAAGAFAYSDESTIKI